MYRLLQAPPVRGVELAVLNALAWFMDTRDWEAHPSVSRLTEMTGFSRRAILEALAALERDGHLLVEHRRDARGGLISNSYRLAAPPLVREQHYPSAPDALPLVQEAHHPSAPGAPPLVRQAHPNKSENNKSVTSHMGTRVRATPFPADFALTAEQVEQAKTAGLDPATEVLKFRAHHEAKGSRMVSWPQAWTTWRLKAVEFMARDQRNGKGINGSKVGDRNDPAFWGLSPAEFEAKRKKGWLPGYETAWGRAAKGS